MQVSCKIKRKNFFVVDGDKETFIEETALAHLLMNDVLFAGERGGTVDLYVDCNDVFAWAVADAEKLPYDKIQELYLMWEKDPRYGPTKWCVLQRKYMPQAPVLEAMKKAGSWDLDEKELEPNANSD